MSAATTFLSRLPMYSRLTAALARSDSILVVRGSPRSAAPRARARPDRARGRSPRGAGRSSCAGAGARSAAPCSRRPDRLSPGGRAPAGGRAPPARRPAATRSAIHARALRRPPAPGPPRPETASGAASDSPPSMLRLGLLHHVEERLDRRLALAVAPVLLAVAGSRCRRGARRCAAARRCRRRCRACAARRSRRRFLPEVSSTHTKSRDRSTTRASL